MLHLTLAILFANIVLANTYELTSLYRTQGLAAVEQYLQEQLTKKEYWQKELENYDLSNGYYESLKYIIICQKDRRNMDVYDSSDKKIVFSSSVFTGEKNGDKQAEGDLKTPVGAYLLNNRITKLDSFYGPLALSTNYPNTFDKAQGKTGHGIWIHGLPEDERREEFTQGCIALDNTKIKKLDQTINIDDSVLIISEQKFPKSSKDEIALILSEIFKWKEAWKESDIDQYLSFYGSDFKKSNGQNFEKFKTYKKRIFSKNEQKTIKFSNINVIPYPNNQNKKLFKVYMDEIYQTRSHRFEGKKELYLELVENKISILSES